VKRNNYAKSTSGVICLADSPYNC